MKSVAEQLREQASRVAAKPSTRSTEGAEAMSKSSTPPPAKRVGKTVNLDADLNQRIAMWQAAAATTLGVPRVTFQAVVDTLLAELLDDELLAMRTRQRLADDLAE
ncbi:MAG: hypothetical protein WAV90_26150 [Gordonia amarae]